MREVSVDCLRDVLEYDPDTGVFRNRDRRGTRARVGAIAGCFNKNKAYWRI